MAGQTVLIIRHAEKPEPGGDSGVDTTGTPDPRSLTPRGWQRAGAWGQLFLPPLGQHAALPTPNALFASVPETHHEIRDEDGGSKSRRPLETITPLAAKLNINVDLRFAKGSEGPLAEAISSIDGVVLVCWQHEDIVAIATSLAPGTQSVPTQWPGDRFNVIFRFDRPDRTAAWVFQQVVPVMLDGDEPSPIDAV